MLKRSGKSRARISEKTLRLISQRPKQLRLAFLLVLRSGLEELDVVLVPLDRGGFGLISLSALDGAPTIKAADLLADHLPGLKKGKADEDKLWAELALEEDDNDELSD